MISSLLPPASEFPFLSLQKGTEVHRYESTYSTNSLDAHRTAPGTSNDHIRLLQLSTVACCNSTLAILVPSPTPHSESEIFV